MKISTAVIALVIVAFWAGSALAYCEGPAAVNPAGSSAGSWLNVAPEGQNGVPEQSPHYRQPPDYRADANGAMDRSPDAYFGATNRPLARNGSAYDWRNVVPEGQNGVPEQSSYLSPTDRATPVYSTIARDSAARDWQSVAAEGQRGVPEQEPFAGAC